MSQITREEIMAERDIYKAIAPIMNELLRNYRSKNTAHIKINYMIELLNKSGARIKTNAVYKMLRKIPNVKIYRKHEKKVVMFIGIKKDDWEKFKESEFIIQPEEYLFGE